MLPCTPNQLPGSFCKPPPARKPRHVAPTTSAFEYDSFFAILRSLHDGSNADTTQTKNSLQFPTGLKPINSSSIAGFHAKELIKKEEKAVDIPDPSGPLTVHSKEIKPKHSRGDIERTNPAFSSRHGDIQDSPAEELVQPSVKIITLDPARPISSRIAVDHLTWLILYVASPLWETRIRDNWARASIAFKEQFGIPVPGVRLSEKWRYIGPWVERQKRLVKEVPGEESVIDGEVVEAMEMIKEREAMRLYKRERVSMAEMQMRITGQVGWLGPYRDETIRLIRARGGEIWDLAERKVKETTDEEDGDRGGVNTVMGVKVDMTDEVGESSAVKVEIKVDDDVHHVD